MKNKIKKSLSFFVCTNTVLFLSLAYFQMLSTDPKSAVFIDFWGRFTVYSLWFIGYTLYIKYLHNRPAVRHILLLIVCLNIPLFWVLPILIKLVIRPTH